MVMVVAVDVPLAWALTELGLAGFPLYVLCGALGLVMGQIIYEVERRGPGGKA